MMEETIETEAHWGVGPYEGIYGHGPVTVFTPPEQYGMQFAACLDCGYLTSDIRNYSLVECDRDQNTINQTWRERGGLSDD